MSNQSVTQTAGAELVTQAARLIRAVRQQTESPRGFRALSILDQFGALGVTRLAELDLCSQPTMSTTVAGLVKQGLVAKHPDPDDARATLVELTDAGRTALAEGRRNHGAVVASLMDSAHLGADDVAAAAAVLSRLIDAAHLTT